MSDCGCEATAATVGLIDRRTYTWDALDADAQATIVVVDRIDLLPFQSVDLCVRVHAASIAYSDGAFASVELQGIDIEPDQPDFVYDGGVLARLLIRDEPSGRLLQRRLPPGALGSARLLLVMQQATSQESNTLTVSVGLVAAPAFRTEAA